MTKTAQAYTRNNNPVDTQALPNRVVRLLSEARWLALAVAAAYLVIIFVSYSKLDPGWSQASDVPKLHNLGGRIGAWFADLFLYIFGFSAWWWCVAMLAAVWVSYRRLAKRFFLEQEQDFIV